MLEEFAEIIESGDDNGNNRIFRLRLPSGREITGLATENFYGGDWDLGPTWNYIVGPERPFLLDTGRYGMGGRLLEMMGRAGMKGGDLDFVLISHGHEDHDGGLLEIVAKTGVRVKAHPIYDRLIRVYPEGAPFPSKATFSASCWHCFMPESFTRAQCTGYHKERQELVIEPVEESKDLLGRGITIYHLPGHSPDALAIQIGEEALLVGDILLPDITPHPSQEKFHLQTQKVLLPRYADAEEIYGLGAYLGSLKKLKEIAGRFPGLIVLPGHRLFYNGRWNDMELGKRIDEIIEHHIQRCAAILEALKIGPKTAEEVARDIFEPRLLKGLGIYLAAGEVLSHAELLRRSRDLVIRGDDLLEGLGTGRFETQIREQAIGNVQKFKKETS